MYIEDNISETVDKFSIRDILSDSNPVVREAKVKENK